MIIYCQEKMCLIGLIQTRVISEQETMHFSLTLLLCVFILIEMALMEGGEEKGRQRERS